MPEKTAEEAYEKLSLWLGNQEDMVDKVKTIIGANTDTELASMLGVSKSAVANGGMILTTSVYIAPTHCRPSEVADTGASEEMSTLSP